LRRVQVQPLVCPSCRGPVLIADADAVTCPYCGASVPVPEDHRKLRRDLTALTDERLKAARLYRRLGRPPPRIMQVFTIFETGWFWLFLAGFYITGGLTAFIAGMPTVGAVVFHVNTWDVLTERQQSMISIGGTVASIAIGVLLAGWSHKRTVSKRGLQAAMLASAPHAPGGPALCRNCGAALGVPEGALGVRCDYCHADNLVQLPREVIARTAKVVTTLSTERNAALTADAKARAELRWSLFWRLLIGGSLTALFVVPFAAFDDDSLGVTRDEVKLYAAPDQLPKWTREDVPHFECDPSAQYFGYPMRLRMCRPPPCEDAYLVALSAKRPFHVFERGGPLGLEAALDGREMGWLSARWKTVAQVPLDNGEVTFVPPLTGWYRLRFIGGETPASIQWCGSQQ
jgi:LSD1 subclass zinc finger protein